LAKVKFGLIGAGNIARVHAWAARVAPLSFEDLDRNDIEYVGVYNRTKSKADFIRDKFGFGFSTSNVDELLDSGVNAVSVTLANFLHLEMVEKAAERNLAILCEKPLEINLERARKMLEITSKKNLITATALVMRFMPSVIFAKKLIDSGKLGKIYHYRAVVAHSRYVNPNLLLEWRMIKAQAGGGALADIGIHLIDLANYLVGDISEVSSIARTFIKERKTRSGEIGIVDVEDAAIMMFSFKNGALGSIEATRFGPGFQELDRVEIHGSNGMIRFYLENPFEIYLCLLDEEYPGVKRIILKPWEKALWPPSKSITGWAFLFVALYHEFFRAVIEGRKAKPDFEDAVKAQEVLEAAYISAGERRWVSIPL